MTGSKDSHLAELHTKAAYAHEAAAHGHSTGDHASAQKLVRKALEYSVEAVSSMLRLRAPFCSLALSAILPFALLTGCNSGLHTTSVATSNPSTPPATFSVSSVTPASGTTQVATSATIQIAFSGAANPATITTSNIVVTDPQPVVGVVSYNSTTITATFTPSAALVPNSTYTVTVAGVKSSAGSAMTGTFTWTFATVTSIGTGGGGGTNTPMQYQASLYNPYANPTNGQISIDMNGNVTVQLTGAAASTTYSVNFCPAYVQYNGTSDAPPCFDTGPVTTDTNGSGTSTTLFPKSGSWAGDFTLFTTSNSTPADSSQYSTGNFPASNSYPGGYPSGMVYMSTLQPESTTNGIAVATQASPQDPLTSGTVTFSNGSMIFAVSGASANTEYSTTESQTVELNNSGANYLSDFTTNASGNASSTESLASGSGGDMFQVQPPCDAGYIGGFSIPN